MQTSADGLLYAHAFKAKPMLLNGGTSPTKAISPWSGQQQSFNLTDDMKQRLEHSVDFGIIKSLSTRTDITTGKDITISDFSASTPIFSVNKSKPIANDNMLYNRTRLNQTAQSAGKTKTVENTTLASLKQIKTQQASLTIRREEPPQGLRSDPLALDLDDDGFRTTGLANGVIFDLLARGSAQQISVSQARDPLLAFDKNHNGIIDDGTELFGDQTGYANGFEALAQHDSNHDNKIDYQDPIYSQLLLLSFNSAGEQQTRSLSSSDIKSISLAYKQQYQALTYNDAIAQSASFTRDDGSQGVAADLLFSVDINI